MLQNAIAAYAEGNGFVIMYPQSMGKNNPATDGCWDWYAKISLVRGFVYLTLTPIR